MTSRIHDNQIKALIYALIFAALMLKIIFWQPVIEERDSGSSLPELVSPDNNRTPAKY